MRHQDERFNAFKLEYTKVLEERDYVDDQFNRLKYRLEDTEKLYAGLKDASFK